jgi:hypothetical protein
VAITDPVDSLPSLFDLFGLERADVVLADIQGAETAVGQLRKGASGPFLKDWINRLAGRPAQGHAASGRPERLS